MITINQIANRRKKIIALSLMLSFLLSIGSFAFSAPSNCACVCKVEKKAVRQETTSVCACMVKQENQVSLKIFNKKNQTPRKCNLKKTQNLLEQVIVANKSNFRIKFQANNFTESNSANSFRKSGLMPEGEINIVYYSPPAFIVNSSLLI